MTDIDEFDLKIINMLQTDASQSIDVLAEKINLSRNATWRRIRRLEQEGVIKARVALVDPEKIGLGLVALIFVRTSTHDPYWLRQFRNAVDGFPQITSVWRMSGDLDYVLRAHVRDVKAYDHLYQRLIAKLPISDVSASFVMEEIKDTTALPLLADWQAR